MREHVHSLEMLAGAKALSESRSTSCRDPRGQLQHENRSRSNEVQLRDAQRQPRAGFSDTRPSLSRPWAKMLRGLQRIP